MSRYITMMKMAMIIGSPGFDIDWRAGRKWNVDDRLTCEGTKRGTLSTEGRFLGRSGVSHGLRKDLGRGDHCTCSFVLCGISYATGAWSRQKMHDCTPFNRGVRTYYYVATTKTKVCVNGDDVGVVIVGLANT